MLFVLCFTAKLAADIPRETEQFFYSLEIYKPAGYGTTTFCAAGSDTIYLLAGAAHFIQARKAFVYYWPPADSLQLDTNNLNMLLDGSLEIKGEATGNMIYPLVVYTYTRQSSEYENRWEVFTDHSAETVWNSYNDEYADYLQKLEAYRTELELYNEETSRLLTAIHREEEAGRDAGKLSKQQEERKEPVIPLPPAVYVYPLQKGFVIKLPAGEYTIRFIDPSGLVMEGSEKKLVVFGKRRENGIGYEILPGDKWASPEKSNTPSAVLYVNGTTDLYFKPFFEDEFNDLFYNKMLNNQAQGNAHLYMWQETRSVADARLEVTDDTGTAELFRETAFRIVQAPGVSHGYSIVPLKKEDGQEDAVPDFKAFHVPVSAKNLYLKIRLQDTNSNYLNLSYREIRIVRRNRLVLIQVLFSLLPLCIFIIVVVMRNRKLKGAGEHRQKQPG